MTTRMHSSRMRTVRSGSRLRGGGGGCFLPGVLYFHQDKSKFIVYVPLHYSLNIFALDILDIIGNFGYFPFGFLTHY